MDPTITLTLDALAFGGEAVGREPSGRVVFVAGGAPGDVVEVRLTERKKSFARGELVRVLEAGERVAPPCPIAGTCGGCPWMHVAPAAQLAAKQEIVRRALAGSGAEVRQIAAAPAWLGYRVRARFTAREGRVGFQARRSHRVIDVETCPALEPALDRAMASARRALGDALGEGGTLAGLAAPDGRVHLALEPGESANRRVLAERSAQLAGGAIAGVTLGAQTFGEARLELGGGVLGSADGFAQANAAQNEALRRFVLDEARLRGGERVLELYAGAGNFTVALAARARVTAVEGDRAAAARLGDALRAGAPPGNFTVRAEAAEQAVATLAKQGARFDVVVLDPPRSGAAAAVEGIAALAPARIVYVSCDPMTLARDVARLGELGYSAVRAQPLDMMPHTSHVEVVCTLERVSGSSRA
ncbi:MAG TPA: TRAM domain-containing protein [Polyangia bacterium]|nr:TRAM domain-containing protein [Polyangia bacterium]